MLVTIVAIANKDNTGLDVDRLEKVEDIHPEVALKMLDGGTAREPSEEELAAYHKAKQPEGNDDQPYDNGGDVPSGVVPARPVRAKMQPTEPSGDTPAPAAE